MAEGGVHRPEDHVQKETTEGDDDDDDDDERRERENQEQRQKEANDKGEDKNKEEEEDASGLEKLRAFFSKTLGISSSKDDDGCDQSTTRKLLPSLDLQGIAEYIKNGLLRDDSTRNIVVMAGAGVSTSAGIPDFRSPGSGLYDNLDKYDLPDPQCIFEISYFKKDPRPFFSLAKELLPGVFKPTVCHYFVKLLHEKGLLLRLYTQNIDTLERIAGIPEEKIVEAHGTFHTSHCVEPSCHRRFSFEWMKQKIRDEELPTCPDCNSYIKPDVVFFGENLPRRFFELCSRDFSKCDLLIIMGTSLAVQPFASLVDKVSKETPRLLINKEKTGQTDPFMRFLGYGTGLDFDSEKNHRDVAWLGLCDDGCRELADLLGWGDELGAMVKKEHERIDRE